MKQGQGLPLNTIIIAALGIIVLVIIVVLVQNQITKSGKGLKNVSEQTCAPVGEVQPIGTDCEVIYGSFKDVTSGTICCRKPA